MKRPEFQFVWKITKQPEPAVVDKIECCDCTYAKSDYTISEVDWVAYECVNPKSPYHTCLLNVTEDGDMENSITWTGCMKGERK